jgi:hypothetical protein
MIPGIIVKTCALQWTARQGSKLQSEVSPEVSPENVVAPGLQKATLRFPLPEKSAWTALGRGGL